MIRKTMRVGAIRTSIKLESEFWDYLKDIAEDRRTRLSIVVNEVATSTADIVNLASTLRTFALMHARLKAHALGRELDRLQLAGNTQDLARVLEACPLPATMLDQDRTIRQLNRAFALWLNLDAKATVGQKLDNVMILRGPNIREMWAGLLDGRLARAGCNATYVSPGKVRTAQALAVALAGGDPARRGCVVMFETLAGRP